MRRLTLATVILSGMVALAATPALAEADPAKGERVFKKCAICHVLEGNKKKPGPSLAGIFGRQAGTFDGFRFSKAMKESGITWTPGRISRQSKETRRRNEDGLPRREEGAGPRRPDRLPARGDSVVTP